ncbi:unnamed protein product [Lasius platythorax]|uniref:Uncharacterized protein n=1 Tax=Lasius platythorax TaxID=488582 RepID=A0AAV2NPI2_9HYME
MGDALGTQGTLTLGSPLTLAEKGQGTWRGTERDSILRFAGRRAQGYRVTLVSKERTAKFPGKTFRAAAAGPAYHI